MKKFLASFLVLVAFATAAPACHPQPVPGDGGGGTVTPSGVLAVVDTIAGILDVILPLIRPLILREVPDGPAKQPVLIALTSFEAAGAAWESGHSTWDARGGASCPAYALTGALTDATRQLARALGDAGIGWGPDLEALVTSCGRLMDRQLGACASVDGGALTASGRVGATIRADLDAIDAAARARGVSLRPLPAVRR